VREPVADDVERDEETERPEPDLEFGADEGECRGDVEPVQREGDDAEADQPSLFADEIPRSDIREACIQYINEDLSDIINGINAATGQYLFEPQTPQQVTETILDERVDKQHLADLIDQQAIGFAAQIDPHRHRRLAVVVLRQAEAGAQARLEEAARRCDQSERDVERAARDIADADARVKALVAQLAAARADRHRGLRGCESAAHDDRAATTAWARA